MPCRREDGTALPLLNAADFGNDHENITDGVLDGGDSSLILSSAGVSGIVHLLRGAGKGEALKPDSNTNLMFQRSIIPTVRQEYEFVEDEEEMRILVAVFAISRKHVSLSGKEIWKLWNDRPVVGRVRDASQNNMDAIVIA